MAKIGIVGGGIIGSAIATWLIADGHEVTVYEREPDGRPASGGNAGFIAVPQIYPVARPGMLGQVPKWLADPLGPLTLRWGDLPSLTPWLIAFLRAANPVGEARTMDALAGLGRSALADHFELGRRARLTGHLRNTGALTIHDTSTSLDRTEALYTEVGKRLDIDVGRITETAARDLVPALQGPFAGALHFRDFWIVSNPLPVLRHYQTFVRNNAKLIGLAARAIEPRNDGIDIVSEGGTATTFDQVVVAAGIWSRDFVRALRLKVLLETERGYNTTWTEPNVQLPMPVMFGDHAFVATPFVDALRVGGAVELARPDAPPNYARARAMRIKMRRYVPTLSDTGGVEWMGRRPSTPDSMPVISRHPRDRRILFAFGHGHMGLTYSAPTARHIAALVGANEDATTLAPFDIGRFN